MVTGADHAPEAVLDEDWIRKTEPSERVQTAITSPLGATTTCGSNASWPAAEMSIEDSQVGVACAAAGAKSATAKAKTRSCQRTALRNVDKAKPLPRKETPARQARW
jgi:hypothetical protein